MLQRCGRRLGGRRGSACREQRHQRKKQKRKTKQQPHRPPTRSTAAASQVIRTHFGWSWQPCADRSRSGRREWLARSPFFFSFFPFSSAPFALLVANRTTPTVSSRNHSSRNSASGLSLGANRIVLTSARTIAQRQTQQRQRKIDRRASRSDPPLGLPVGARRGSREDARRLRRECNTSPTLFCHTRCEQW